MLPTARPFRGKRTRTPFAISDDAPPKPRERPPRRPLVGVDRRGTERSDRRALGNDPGGAICVRRLDDSLNSAIRTRYRSLLRSSSMHEPRDPPLEVLRSLLRGGPEAHPC